MFSCLKDLSYLCDKPQFAEIVTSTVAQTHSSMVIQIHTKKRVHTRRRLPVLHEDIKAGQRLARGPVVSEEYQ
jgi:hypothetical protein